MREKITPDEPERRTTYSETGGEKGTKLARYDLIPVAPLEEVAKVYGKGSEKYEDRNWERGYEWSKSYAALCRHLAAFWDGEDIDHGTPEEPGTDRHHLGNVIFHAMALMEMQHRGTGKDDRPASNVAPSYTFWDEVYPSQHKWNDYAISAEFLRPRNERLEVTDVAQAYHEGVTNELDED